MTDAHSPFIHKNGRASSPVIFFDERSECAGGGGNEWSHGGKLFLAARRKSARVSTICFCTYMESLMIKDCADPGIVFDT